MRLSFEDRQYLRKQVSKARIRQLKAQYRKHDNCGGCGGALDACNDSCTTCRRRRLRRAETPIHCEKCGKSLTKDTMRRRARLNSPIAHKPVCYSCSRDRCGVCGNDADAYTDGCQGCRSRHYRRKRDLREREPA